MDTKILDFMEKMEIDFNYGKIQFSENYGVILENTKDMEVVEKFIDENKIDIDLLYSDEYTTCQECNEIMEYCKMKFLQNDFFVCDNCIKENYTSDYIDTIENDYKKCNMILSINELEKIGYILIEENFENGFYGVNDEPKKIFEKYENDYKSLIFHIDSKNPFAVYFSLYGKK
jgi:hypothetical protein